jgi:cytochrome c oxidase assembly factor CtaG
VSKLPLAAVKATDALLQLGPLALIGLFYARRARALARHAHPQPRWRAICFYCGLALIAGTLTGLDSASEELLYAHMIEHLLVGDLAALLIVLGLTGPLLAPLLRNKLIDRLRALSHPAIAFPLWTLDLYLWHAPALYEAALRHPAIHALEHLSFVGFGINMWMCLLGPLPTPRWFGNLGRLVYILAVRLAGTVLGNIFLWSGTVFYPFYLHGDALHRISPLADQNLAGAVMMVEESIVTLGLFCWLFLRTARESEERQELLDFARTRGLQLDEARAARAVAAGRGAELRRRLAAQAGDSAAGDGGQDRQLGAVGHGGREPVEKADVLAGNVDVHEAPQ